MAIVESKIFGSKSFKRKLNMGHVLRTLVISVPILAASWCISQSTGSPFWLTAPAVAFVVLWTADRIAPRE